MPTIVYQTNPKTGVKYAYESTSYWDKDKKAPRSTRRYLGRVDPETGEIIMKGERKRAGAPEKTAAGETASADRDAEIAALRKQLEEVTFLYEDALKRLKNIAAIAATPEA